MQNRSLLLKLLSAALVFGAWEIAGRVPISYAFPTFVESMGALLSMALDGSLFVAYAETLRPLVVGVAALLFAHIFENIGMQIQLMPITGIPLPFVSYGGTFLITVMLLLGLVQSVWVHRHRALDEERERSRRPRRPLAPPAAPQPI